MKKKQLAQLALLLAKYITANEAEFPVTTCKARDVLHYVQSDIKDMYNDQKNKTAETSKAKGSRKAKC